MRGRVVRCGLIWCWCGRVQIVMFGVGGGRLVWEGMTTDDLRFRETDAGGAS